jgi:hypothetical protein
MKRRQFLVTVPVVLAGCSTEEVSGDDPTGEMVELNEHDFQMRGQYNSAVVGTVENITDTELSMVSVEIAFVDSEGTQFAESLDSVTDLAAGRTWEFEALLTEEPHRVDDYDISVDVTE